MWGFFFKIKLNADVVFKKCQINFLNNILMIMSVPRQQINRAFRLSRRKLLLVD